MADHKEPPAYFNGGGDPHAQQPQMVYMNHQSPYMGQQTLPTVGYQQTTVGMVQPPMVPMQPVQPHLTGQPSMMSMNANMGVGQQQPVHPQSTGVQMNVMMPGMMAVPNYMTLCQQGQHSWETRYGPCGIITAIILFPIGLIALFLDVEERCTRCGQRR